MTSRPATTDSTSTGSSAVSTWIDVLTAIGLVGLALTWILLKSPQVSNNRVLIIGIPRSNMASMFGTPETNLSRIAREGTLIPLSMPATSSPNTHWIRMASGHTIAQYGESFPEPVWTWARRFGRAVTSIHWPEPGDETTPDFFDSPEALVTSDTQRLEEAREAILGDSSLVMVRLHGPLALRWSDQGGIPGLIRAQSQYMSQIDLSIQKLITARTGLSIFIVTDGLSSVAGLPESMALTGGFALAWGETFGAGTLEGLARPEDLQATLLAILNVPIPASTPGQPIRELVSRHLHSGSTKFLSREVEP